MGHTARRKSFLRALHSAIKFLSLLPILFSAACSGAQPALTTPATSIPTAVASTPRPAITSTSASTQTPQNTAAIPTAEQTPVPQFTRLNAAVWGSNPLVPIVNYHRFTPRASDPTSGMVKYLGEFIEDLTRLNDAGYTLISIDDYLAGRLSVPPGRRPLILTFDDALFANQLALEENGEPSPLTAIGALYDFSMEHPDFGFKAAMFANLGDKYYGNVFRDNWWYLGEGWQDALARTLAWALDHDVMIYNHFYTHPRLSLARDKDIQPQLLQNDLTLRSYLERVGRSELAGSIENCIALPYGEWPASQKGIELLLGYVNPEGKPVRAVFEAGYEYAPTLALSPYDPGFDPLHIPRMAALGRIIDWLVETAPSLPSAQDCQLQVPEGQETNSDQVIMDAMSAAVEQGQCAEGVYLVEGRVFRVTTTRVDELIDPLN